MIVKDLQKYIKSLTEGKVPEKIGAENDPLLTALVGETRDLESEHIKLLTDFATESNTQIFYELLQNAEDEKANQVFFYFDDENFVVINNGSPFYTDPKNSQLNRDGQLRGFLAKGRGGKSSNSNKIGEKGLGSKLLYDLMVNIDNEDISKKEGLSQSLIDDTKGLILFSWSNLNQWEQFIRSNPSQFDFNGDPSDDTIALLTKIVYAYYPSNLNENGDTIRGKKLLFSQNELQSCLNYLQKIKSDLPLTALEKGTLIYVPLGRAKAQKLKAVLDQEIISGISGSMAFLDNIKYATLNQIKIKKLDFKKTSLPIIVRGKQESKVTLAFPLAPLSINYELVNFYKFLPVTLTHFGLKFIVNSKAYEIDASRQHIKLEESKNILQEIGANISFYISSLKNTENRDEYLAFMKCILLTDIGRIKASKDSFYKEHFYDNLIETIKKNIPIIGGFSTDINEVRIKSTEINIIPQDLGVSWKWVDKDLEDVYDKVEDILKVKKSNIFDVLSAVQANNIPKVVEWVKNLKNDEYDRLVEELTKKSISFLKDISFIRCSDSEIRSINDIHGSTKVVFLTSEIKGLKSIFDRLTIKYTDISLGKLPEPYESKNITKIIVLLNDSVISDHHDKWTVFDVFKSINQVPSLKIFENQIGEKRPLSLLLHNSSNLVSSGVLKRFAIKPSEVDAYRGMTSFMMKPEDIWEYLISDWNLHVTKDLDYIALIKDLNTLYNKRLLTNTTRKPENINAWIRTDTGEWAKSSEIFFSTPLSKLSENEYDLLIYLVKRATSLKTIYREDVKFIESVRFSEIPHFNFESLKNKFNHSQINITRRELDVLLKIKVVDSLLGSFIIQDGENGGYRLILKERNHKQYISKDRELNAFLVGRGYHLLPVELETVFMNDAFLIKENEGFALDLLNIFHAERAFVSLVKKQSRTVKERYLNQISRIEFNSQDSIESYDDTYEGKVLEIAIELGLEESIGAKIVIDNQPLKSYKNSDEVKITTIIKFSLFQLLPKYGEYSVKLATIRTKVSNKIKKIFNAEPYKLELIEDELPKQLNNPEQVAFLVAFYNSEKGAVLKNKFSSFDFSQIDEKTVLDSLMTNKRNLFSYANLSLPSNWFNPKIHIDCNDEDLILNTEKIPSYIRSWMSSDTERKDFLYSAGLINEQRNIIALRKGIFRDERVESDIIKGSMLPDYFIHNTLTWIIEKEKGQIFSRSSDKYRNILQFIKDSIIAKQSLPPVFITSRDLENYQILSSFTIQNLLYVNNYADIDKQIFKDALARYTELNIVVNDGCDSFLKGKGIFEFKLESELDLGTHDFDEWNDKSYKEWKLLEEVKYTIHVSTKEIPRKYWFTWNSEKKEIKTYPKGQTEKHKNEIYLNQKSQEDDLFALLNENMKTLFGSDSYLMGKLMNLRLKHLTTKISDNKGINGNGGNVSVDENKKEIINEIKGFDTAVLNRLKELGDKILKFNVDDLELISESDLEQLKQEKEKEEKSTPSELIGRIGEELAMKWLEERGLEPEHVAVTQNKYEYDILVPEDETGIERYIDVKTTTKSVIENDASVPLHIHKHAMKFLEAEADRNYFIVRISMGDLGIDHWNTQLKDRFNFKGKDRKLNDELIEAIQVKVNEFWEKPKNQKLFEKTVKEFRLTIPKMVLAEIEN